MNYQNLLKVVPIIHSASLVKENLKVIKKKPKTKDMLELGVKNIIGVNLIKIESDFISGL